MPHAALKMIPGVDTQKTPALNEVALSQTNLIRFLPDRSGMGLPQKLGGWTKYYPNTISSAVRNLKSWQDLNGIDYLAVGARKSPIKLGPTCPAMTVLDFGTIESIIAPTAEPTNRDDGASPFTADRSGFTFSNVGAGR